MKQDLFAYLFVSLANFWKTFANQLQKYIVLPISHLMPNFLFVENTYKSILRT